MPDNDNSQFQLIKPKTFGYQLKLKEIKLGSQPLPTYSDPPSVWIMPMDVQFIQVGNTDLLKLTGKLIAEKYRRNYLTQTPERPSEPSVGVDIYSDKTPDFMSGNNQFNLGITGFGFKGDAQLYIQGSASHPNSIMTDFDHSANAAVKYDSYQFVLSTGTLPLAVLRRHNLGLTLQGGVDQTGKSSYTADLEFKKSFIKSINLNVNSVNLDLRGKLMMDSATVSLVIPFP